MAATYITLHLTQNELILVHRFMQSHIDVFHLGAIGREDEYPALAILARLIRKTRGRSLLQIVDSHQAHGVLSDIRVLRVSHAATGPWLDALEDHLSTTADDTITSLSILNGQVRELSVELERRTKNKGDATFEEISYILSWAIRARTILEDRRAKMNNEVFLPADNLPWSHD